MKNSLRFHQKLAKQFVCPYKNVESDFNPKLRLQNMIHQRKLQRLQAFSKQKSENWLKGLAVAYKLAK